MHRVGKGLGAGGRGRNLPQGQQEGGALSVGNLKAIIKPIKSLFGFYSRHAPEILKRADDKIPFPTEEGCSPLPSGGSRNKSRDSTKN